ncbi:MAG TPA: M1 family aminopeptidase [Ramlibacter sp.]|nr:M1 family aminopeptidase [Ramlibacter sp.]
MRAMLLNAHVRDFVARLLAGACLCLPLFAAAADPSPPVMRLGDDVRPLAYELAVTLVPDAPGFNGQVDIDVDLRRPLDFFWMNGRGLEIQGAQLVTAKGKVLQAETVPGGVHFIGLRLSGKAPAGRARLSITYTGKYTANETRGVFVQQERGDWYAFTQFEPLNARRAFPCFDEPRWKTPWTLTLNVRREHVAVANAPAIGETDAGPGMKQVRFAKSKPLPTYLVAFATGPFDIVDGGTAGINRTPLRYIVPKGRAAHARFAREATPRLLEIQESYFGRPYPYEKLDSIAIPVTVAFGAMENPGLITYRSSILLAGPGRDDERFQQLYAAIGAHEIAHQWFGDLVTMQWFTDIWLNESFATWMGRKTVQQYRPDWSADAVRERERHSAAMVDRLSSTRQVRQPVETHDHLANAFDRITYDKGGALLTMFEGWMGEARFRDGVRRYLNRHAWGNATSEDFFRALAESDSVVAKAFSSFVSQPGLPLVDFELDCTRKGAPAVVLRQQRFEPLRTTVRGKPQRWTLPVCLRHEGMAGDKPFCTMLRDQRQRVVLPKAAACPAWLLPNPGGKGYYLSRLRNTGTGSLPVSQLGKQEAVSFLNDQAFLAVSGALGSQDLLAIVAPFSADARPEVVAAAANAIHELHPAWFAAGRPQALGAWVREHFGARAVQVGWLPRAGETDADRRLRGLLLPLATEIGEIASLRTEARALAMSWLAGERKPLGAGFRSVLRSAARDGDGALFDAMTGALAKEEDSGIQFEIYRVLGSFPDPALRVRAFEFALRDGVDVRESSQLYESAGDNAEVAPALFQFIRERYDELARKLPESTVARMPRWHRELCSAEDLAALRALYEPRRPGPPGFERNLSQAIESIEICNQARSGAGRTQ